MRSNVVPLCETPKVVDVLGNTEGYGFLNVVGVGLWFPDGKKVSVAGANVPQPRATTLLGTRKPDTFQKYNWNSVSRDCPTP